MASSIRVLVAFLALILVARHVAAGLEQTLSANSNDDRNGNSDSSKPTRMILVLYQDLNTNSNFSMSGTTAGNALIYSTPLYKTKTLSTKVGAHSMAAVLFWDDVTLFASSFNLGRGLLTATGASKWTENVCRLAVTGATGAFVGFSGTLFMYGLDGSVKDSKRHQLVFKLSKP